MLTYATSESMSYFKKEIMPLILKVYSDIETANKVFSLLSFRFGSIRTRCSIKGVIKGSENYYGLPFISRSDFFRWALSNDDFWIFFDAYKLSGYQQRLTVSIDRLDTSKGYVIGNMRWLPWHKHCTLSGHIGAKKKFNRTGYKGVVLVKRGKARFKAYYKVGGVMKTIGFFPTAEEAARARDQVVRKLYGSESSLNFPDAPICF